MKPSALMLAAATTASTPLASASQETATTSPSASGCAALAEHRQFDFWLGSWNVYNPNGELAGHSRIESISGSCGISEHWEGAKGGGGVSYNAWDPGSGNWRQFWVGNSSGDVLYLVGGLRDGSMVLEGSRPNPANNKPQRQRITWTPHADASVRQLWETSDDDGVTWTVAFDGSYRRKQR